jgi:hypothetical protein
VQILEVEVIAVVFVLVRAVDMQDHEVGLVAERLLRPQPLALRADADARDTPGGERRAGRDPEKAALFRATLRRHTEGMLAATRAGSCR